MLALGGILAAILPPGCRVGKPSIQFHLIERGRPTTAWQHAAHDGRTEEENEVALSAAVNETATFRFAIQASNGSIRSPRLEIGDLVTSGDIIDATAIRVFRMHQIANDDYPGWHLRYVPPHDRIPRPWDVLVPLGAPQGGWPPVLKNGEAYHFWVDVSVPKASTPGRYHAALVVRDGKRVLQTIRLTLDVWPFSLPDDTVPMIGDVNRDRLIEHQTGQAGTGLGKYSDTALAVLANTMRHLRAHGLTPVFPDLVPAAKVGTHATAEIDWAGYEQVAAPLVDGLAFPDRRPLKAWPFPLPTRRHEEPTSRKGSASRDAWDKSFIEACAAYFDRKGWLPISFAALSGPAIAQGAHATVLEIARRIKDADPRIPILVPWFPQDAAPFGWTGYQVPAFEPFADVWLPPAQYFDAKKMAQERSRGRRTWFAADRPPFSGTAALHAGESTVRVLALQALQTGAQAVHLGWINPWPASRASPSPAECIRFDARALIFPGKPFGWSEPVASVRLKHLRRSAQDAAYHALLRQHGLEHISETILDALTPYAGTAAYHTHYADGRPIAWPLDPSIFDVARQIMAWELMDKVGGAPSAEDVTAPNRDLLWRRLMTETRQFRAEVQGVRLRPQSGDETLEVEALLDLTNLRRTPVAGCIKATALPADWVADEATGCFRSLRPGGSKSTRARWSASTIQSDADGHVVLPLELVMEEGEPQSLTAVLSCVVAQRPDRPIRIDGDLRDWSPGRQNVAGSFKLISRSTERDDDREPSAQSKTFGFVARDEDSLYIAIRCESKTKRGSPAERKNRVTYEDMIPMGEELVEVLLDPLNTGVRSPEDLYHVVVKRSGMYLLEKGVRFDPPCGRCEPWTAQVEVASATRSDAWTVELRIPFAAFDVVDPALSVWGFNITRFDLHHKEFSTWSGARRNAYDPASLGNLYFPDDRIAEQTADLHR